MPAPPAGKLPKDYDRLPVPQPQATSERKKDPKMPAAPVLHVLSVNLDTCIGCMACEKWCPDDYDAIRMVPFATVSKDRDAYETATFTATLPVKKIGG